MLTSFLCPSSKPRASFRDINPHWPEDEKINYGASFRWSVFCFLLQIICMKDRACMKALFIIQFICFTYSPNWKTNKLEEVD